MLILLGMKTVMKRNHVVTTIRVEPLVIYDGNSRICFNAKLVDGVACIHLW